MDKYTVWMVTAHSPLQIIAYHHTNAPLLVQTIQTHYPRFPHPTSFPKIAPITPEFTVSGTQQIRFDTANMLRQENSEQTFMQTQLDGHVIGSISETKRVTWRRIR